MAITQSNPTFTTTLNNSGSVTGVTSTFYAGGSGGGGSGYPSNINISNNTWSNDPTLTVGGRGHLELRGENADLVINGVSLSDTLQAIQYQLNILIPNPALEAEWDELQELGELYRKKEAEFKEKKRMWEIMKKAE